MEVVPLIVELLPVNELRPPDELTVFVIVTVPDAAEAFRFPAASEKLPNATVTAPEPLEVVKGVKVTEYEIPLPVKLDKAPPVALTSAEVNVADVSVSPTDTLAHEPAFTEAGVTVALGAVVSITIESAVDEALVTPPTV